MLNSFQLGLIRIRIRGHHLLTNDRLPFNMYTCGH